MRLAEHLQRSAVRHAVDADAVAVGSGTPSVGGVNAADGSLRVDGEDIDADGGGDVEFFGQQDESGQGVVGECAHHAVEGFVERCHTVFRVEFLVGDEFLAGKFVVFVVVGFADEPPEGGGCAVGSGSGGREVGDAVDEIRVQSLLSGIGVELECRRQGEGGEGAAVVVEEEDAQSGVAGEVELRESVLGESALVEFRKAGEVDLFEVVSGKVERPELRVVEPDFRELVAADGEESEVGILRRIERGKLVVSQSEVRETGIHGKVDVRQVVALEVHLEEFGRFWQGDVGKSRRDDGEGDEVRHGAEVHTAHSHIADAEDGEVVILLVRPNLCRTSGLGSNLEGGRHVAYGVVLQVETFARPVDADVCLGNVGAQDESGGGGSGDIELAQQVCGHARHLHDGGAEGEVGECRVGEGGIDLLPDECVVEAYLAVGERVVGAGIQECAVSAVDLDDGFAFVAVTLAAEVHTDALVADGDGLLVGIEVGGAAEVGGLKGEGGEAETVAPDVKFVEAGDVGRHDNVREAVAGKSGADEAFAVRKVERRQGISAEVERFHVVGIAHGEFRQMVSGKVKMVYAVVVDHGQVGDAV